MHSHIFSSTSDIITDSQIPHTFTVLHTYKNLYWMFGAVHNVKKIKCIEVVTSENQKHFIAI